MRKVAEILRFNYTIQERDYPSGNETWTDWFNTNIRNSDLVMSYWTKIRSRMELGFFVEGHVDISVYLIGLAPKHVLPPFSERCLSLSSTCIRLKSLCNCFYAGS